MSRKSQKSKMGDLIVLLPGITGSVLQKDGKDVWAVSNQGTFDHLWDMRENIQKLKLEGDDYEIDDLDGIKATRLIQDIHFVPGLVKINGYTALASRLHDNFELNDKNYFEFPYDWRRDNRFAARQLEEFIHPRLTQWRDTSGNENAKVILIAHSMGGLVSRYYLEVLGGWEKCKALITFGTPYRGSIETFSYLAKGYKQRFTEFTDVIYSVTSKFTPLIDVMRSWTSMYQLLPNYEMLKFGEKYQKVAETDVTNIQNKTAKDALIFHQKIFDEQKRNAQNEFYNNNFSTRPYIGIKQTTYQSAHLLNEQLEFNCELPSEIDEGYDGGDGTVSRFSATPIEFDYNTQLRVRSRYEAETHGSLQANNFVLNDLVEQLRNLQIPEIERKEPPKRGGSRKSYISLELEDFYIKNQIVKIKAELKGDLSDDEIDEIVLEAYIEPVNKSEPERCKKFEKSNEEGLLSLPDLNLKPGLYRLKVKPVGYEDFFPNPIHDLFEVGQ